jgi:hypothetical protein
MPADLRFVRINGVQKLRDRRQFVLQKTIRADGSIVNCVALVVMLSHLSPEAIGIPVHIISDQDVRNRVVHMGPIGNPGCAIQLISATGSRSNSKGIP